MQNKPLMIYVHGGGFISGITEMRNTYLQNFAKEGFYTASVSYTYAPKKVFPSQLQEICCAIDHIFDSADENHIDTTRVLLSGESAGVYFIFMLASLATESGLAQKLGIEFRHVNDFKISAMVAHSGCIDLKKLLDPNYPQSEFPDIQMMTCSFLGMPLDKARKYLDTPEGYLSYAHINKDFPPTFFATGAKDHLRFESYDAMKTYDDLGIPYYHYEGTGAMGNHAWTIVTILKKGKECLERTFEFIEPYFSLNN